MSVKHGRLPISLIQVSQVVFSQLAAAVDSLCDVPGFGQLGGAVMSRIGYRDDRLRIPNREFVLGIVLGHPDDRVFVSLVVVGPDVDVAGRRIHPHALEHGDDDVILRPSADQ